MDWWMNWLIDWLVFAIIYGFHEAAFNLMPLALRNGYIIPFCFLFMQKLHLTYQKTSTQSTKSDLQIARKYISKRLFWRVISPGFIASAEGCWNWMCNRNGLWDARTVNLNLVWIYFVYFVDSHLFYQLLFVLSRPFDNFIAFQACHLHRLSQFYNVTVGLSMLWKLSTWRMQVSPPHFFFAYLRTFIL